MNKQLPLFALLLFLIPFTSYSQLTYKKLVGADVNTPNRVAGDQFGFSIAVSGDIAVIGAPFHDYDESGGDSMHNAGAAYVFYRNEGGTNNWGLKKKLVATGNNARDTGDNFGNSVAIDGNTIVVGAIFQDFNASGLSEFSDAGAAYVFYKDEGGTDNWGLKEKLVGRGLNARKTDDNFGNTVAISGDVIAVGAYQHDYGADGSGANFKSFAGAVFIYYRNEGGADSWGLKQKIVAEGTNGRNTGDFFGTALAMDGDIIVVGANLQDFAENGAGKQTDAGAAYVFYKNEGGTDNWGFKKKLVGAGSNGRLPDDNFGSSLAIDGDVIVVGAYLQDYNADGTGFVSDAGAAYVYYKNEGGTDNWGFIRKLAGSGTHSREVSDNFGTSVAITGDAILVGVSQQDYDSLGADLVSGAGAAYIFHKDFGGTNNWGLKQRLVSVGTNNRIAGDNFGNTVACTQDVILVGVSGQDYDADGNTMLSNSGAAMVFNYSRKNATSVAEVLSPQNLRVAANHKNILLNFEQAGNYTMAVHDITGRAIYQNSFKTVDKEFKQITLHHVAAGYYMVQVKHKNTVKAFKVFLQ